MVELEAAAWPAAPVREWRAAWVASVAHIDWPKEAGLSAAVLREQILQIVQRAQAVGLNALILLVVGFSVGYLFYAAERPVLLTLGVVALAAGAVPLATAAISSVLGSTRVIWEAVPAMVVASMAYALVLTPFIVPGLSWLVRKAGAPIAP